MTAPSLETVADCTVVGGSAYTLTLPRSRGVARVTDAGGFDWMELALAFGADTTSGLDETLALGEPEWTPSPGGGGESPGARVAAIELTSSRWKGKRLRIRCTTDEIGFWIELEGEGEITDLHLGGGWDSSRATQPGGFARSRRGFASVLNPAPGPVGRYATAATTPASIDVLGGPAPVRGQWFFTPAPYCFAFSRERASDGELSSGPWLSAGIATPIDRQTFTGFHYDTVEEGFSLRLSYEGQTRVSGSWVSPELRLRFGAADPYAAIASWRESLERDQLVPVAPWRIGDDDRPAWWRRPIFCGWGAQSALAVAAGDPSSTATFATQANYDAFLRSLGAHGIHPPTIVLDDKWQATYGDNQPDRVKWPDLRAWIAARHAAGQRVLLWWKAWDPEGVPAAECVRRPDGTPVAVDPTNPAYLERLRRVVRALLGPGGLDADGFKVDFSHRTPSGPSLVRRGPEWGAALLHRLLAELYRAAKDAKPDALLITQTPNPSFSDVSDMIRLNDALRLSDPRPWAPVVPQMLHRAAIARAATPDLLIDTDDWAMPDLATWRAYQREKRAIGVPSLYYVDRIDQSGEAFEEADFALIREEFRAID